MKIEFDSNDKLPVNKTIGIPIVKIVIRAVFHENIKYYITTTFLDQYLYYDRNDVSEGIDVNKTSASKECDVCHYWYFLNYSSKFQLDVFNRCYDLLMMPVNLTDIAILSIKGSNYCCIISLTTKNEAINFLQNRDLTEKSGTYKVYIKMERIIIKFGNIEIKKQKFH